LMRGGSKESGLSGFRTVQQAFQVVRERGKVIQAANLDGIMEIDPLILRSNKVKWIHTGPASADDLRHVAFLAVSKRIRVAPQISHVLHGLEKLPEALEISANKAKYRATNPVQIVVW